MNTMNTRPAKVYEVTKAVRGPASAWTMEIVGALSGIRPKSASSALEPVFAEVLTEYLARRLDPDTDSIPVSVLLGQEN